MDHQLRCNPLAITEPDRGVQNALAFHVWKYRMKPARVQIASLLQMLNQVSISRLQDFHPIAGAALHSLEITKRFRNGCVICQMHCKKLLEDSRGRDLNERRL